MAEQEVDQTFQLHPPTLETGGTTISPTATTSSKPKATSNGNPPSSVPGAIPMSMPSLLRNPGGVAQSNHLAYLLDRRSASSSFPPSSSRNTRSRASKEPQLGRRKQRRSDNALLLSNPHAVRPTLKDYRLHSNEIRSTFPHPHSGAKKGASEPVPSSSRVGYSEPSHDAIKANEGHFGSSLKEANRVLKRLEVGDAMVREGRAGELERFIWLVEREVRTWAEGDIHIFAEGQDRKVGSVLLDESCNFTLPPFAGESEVGKRPTVHLDTVVPGQGGQLIEFQRTPNALVWLVHDPFLRLIVHCLARVLKCPSFSKDDVNRPGLRFTWILNRNPLIRRSRRGRRVSVSSSTAAPPPPPARGMAGMETPPTTDFDSQTESEAGVDTDTDAGDSVGGEMVIVNPPGEERIAMAGEEQGVDTDEEEAEILRRVRRWAIDSHRQRAEREGDSRDSSPAGVRVKPTKDRMAAEDPDATLTAEAIAEEDDDEDDVLSLSDP